MNPELLRESTSDTLGTLVLLAALAMSGFVAVGLISADVTSARQLRATRLLASETPSAGTLRGQNAIDSSEWVPKSSQDDKGKLVLFTVAEPGKKWDVAFWLDVATQVRSKEPDAEYVGFCVAGRTCSLPPGAEGVLTLVTSMDPAQIHGLALAARQERMLVYRGTGLQTMLAILTSSKGTASNIVRAFGAQSPRQPGAGDQ